MNLSRKGVTMNGY